MQQHICVSRFKKGRISAHFHIWDISLRGVSMKLTHFDPDLAKITKETPTLGHWMTLIGLHLMTVTRWTVIYSTTVVKICFSQLFSSVMVHICIHYRTLLCDWMVPGRCHTHKVGSQSSEEWTRAFSFQDQPVNMQTCLFIQALRYQHHAVSKGKSVSEFVALEWAVNEVRISRAEGAAVVSECCSASHRFALTLSRGFSRQRW